MSSTDTSGVRNQGHKKNGWREYNKVNQHKLAQLTISVLCFILEVIKWLLSQNLVNTLGPLMISLSTLPLQSNIIVIKLPSREKQSSFPGMITTINSNNIYKWFCFLIDI